MRFSAIVYFINQTPHLYSRVEFLCFVIGGKLGINFRVMSGWYRMGLFRYKMLSFSLKIIYLSFTLSAQFASIRVHGIQCYNYVIIWSTVLTVCTFAFLALWTRWFLCQRRRLIPKYCTVHLHHYAFTRKSANIGLSSFFTSEHAYNLFIIIIIYNNNNNIIIIISLLLLFIISYRKQKIVMTFSNAHCK
jgi:hypothetical protein